MNFFTYIRSFFRFFHIFVILIKQGVLYLRLRTGFISGPGDKKKIKKTGIDTAQFVRVTLVKLGSTFVKFGQFMSVRPDLLSAEYRYEFRLLQDKVSPFSLAEVREIMDAEYKGKHKDIFDEFDEVPVASASISQVHRARLLSGEEVAVKIQRPEIQKVMQADIVIMGFLAYLVERFIPQLRKNRPRMLVEEFSQWTEHELDFQQEGKNAVHFHYHFKDYEGVKFPAIYPSFTTKKILVMEFLNGRNLLEVPEEDMDRQLVVRRITESMLKQIFQDGFFHGDPHPGNIFLLKGNEIAYLDFGIVGHLRMELRELAFDCLFGMAEGDINRVIESFIELCGVDEDEVDIQAYRRRINEVLGDLHVCQICDIPLSSVLEKFLNTSLDYGFYIPADVVIMSKAIATLEGTLQSFAPEINIFDFFRSYAKKILIAEPDLESVLKNIIKGPYKTERWARLMSRRLNRVITRFERGSIRLEGDEFRHIVSEMDKSSLNMSSGMIIASLIIFAAVLSDETAFEYWLRTLFDLPDIHILPIASLVAAGYLSLKLYLRNRCKRQKK